LFRFEDRLPDERRDLRDDRISEGSQTVHPSGNPISHSTHVGFSAPLTKVPRAAAALRWFDPPPIVIPLLRGVGNIFAIHGNDFPRASLFRFSA
jgi:hypothetical protein